METGLNLGENAPDLPQSAAGREGGTGGSLGGASASDLTKGFYAAGDADTEPAFQVPDPPAEKEGFLGRPHGWER